MRGSLNESRHRVSVSAFHASLLDSIVEDDMYLVHTRCMQNMGMCVLEGTKEIHLQNLPSEETFWY